MNQFDLNEQILAYWKQTNAFQESLASRSEKMKWKFYDGPPFTSGDPHYGHLLQSAVKDAIPRWMTMRGYKVARKRWWDCHGIPAENFVNKKLGITSKKQVLEDVGMQKYVEECRTMVNNVNDNRKRFVDHIWRWADMENAYFTMHKEYMESVIHLFADLYNNNLIYKGFKVLWYSRALWTALSNSEIAEGYMDRQDPAVTVKLRLKAKSWKLKALREEFEVTDDGYVHCAAGLIEKEWKYLMVYDTKFWSWFFPGWKVDKWETIEQATIREVKEEINLEVIKSDYVWSINIPQGSTCWSLDYVKCEIRWDIINNEPKKQSSIAWIDFIESENELWFSIRIDAINQDWTNIIDDVDQIFNDFWDYLIIKDKIYEIEWMSTASISLLARTTTPRTLPSNMFGAVNADPEKKIYYAQVFDLDTKEHYILAESLLNKYYKDKDDYIYIHRLDWKHLIWLDYEPLFDYYYQSPDIDSKYHDKVHKILHADFVTEDSGTGIAHEAPAFGEDDYNLVTSLKRQSDNEKISSDELIFPADKAKERLFNPVDDHGEFTEEVSDFAGMNVIESNQSVIQYLKEAWTLMKHETLNHSYPHCPRTKEPIIYRAMESRFLKEKQLTEKSLPLADTINFVPPEIKKRFVNGLESAPDWNISRSRFWWAPLPIWECEKETCEQRKVFWSLQEIAEASGQEVNDLHRPYIDEITIDCECGGVMRRIPEVLDCWFESGSMPFAQDHWMKNNFQESEIRVIDQTDVANVKNSIHDVVMWFSASWIREIISWKKTKTYRLGDKYLSKLNIWDIVSVEHSGTQEIVWELKVIDLSWLTFGEIPLITSGHPWFDSPMDKKLKWKQFYGKDIQDSERITVIDFEFIVLNSWNSTFEDTGVEWEDFSTTADFIAEWLDQTRGWFRSLHVLWTAYTDNLVYKNVVVTWMILAEDGKKMSKSLKNYPDPKWLLEKYGADAFRLYVLGSPVVRAEPLRFQEKWVEQVLKDFVIPLQNVWNFFSTYANVDARRDDGTEMYFMRHAEKVESWKLIVESNDENVENKDIPLSKEWEQQIKDKDFVERVTRIDPDIIITTNRLRAIQTAEWAQKVLKEYSWKDVEVIQRDNLVDWFDATTCWEIYNNLTQEFKGKKILIVSHRRRFLYLWNELYGTTYEHWDSSWAYWLNATQIVKLPISKIHNELDQRIISELHTMVSNLDSSLQGYEIEPAVKTLMWFMDKLTNRRLRRSRRRFWVEGMTDDKQAVYWTLWEVLSTYIKLAAPFAPFVTERIWQEMNTFRSTDAWSIHLQYWPLVSEKAINTDLSQEIAQVRKIIKWAMYLRAKQKIKVKQPLQELKFKV